MIEITGEIEGNQVLSKGQTHISEQGQGHFMVDSGETTSEIFLTSSGLLSDGNVLDSVEVIFETERERIIRNRFSSNQKGSSHSGATKGMILKASMPGMVKAVSVNVGDEVQKNTQVLVLEAMKMENSITAGFSGIVSKVLVESGMSVEKNAALIEFRTRE